MMLRMAGADATFGSEIRRRRLALGLSQAWLSERVGMNRDHLSKVEVGRIGAPLEPLRGHLLAVLDSMESDRGITPLTPQGEPGTPQESTEDPLLDLVFAEARLLDDEGRQMLAEQVKIIRRYHSKTTGRGS